MKKIIKYIIIFYFIPLLSISQINIYQPSKGETIVIGNSITVKWTKNYFGPVDLYYKLEVDNDWKLYKRAIFEDSCLFDLKIKNPTRIDFLAKTFTYTSPFCIDTILNAHDTEIREAIFSKDYSKIASIDKFEKVKLWDWKKKQLLNEIKIDNEVTLSSLKFNHDETKIIFVTDSTIYIWDLTKINSFKKLNFHTRYSFVDMHPFENKIVASSFDGFIILINLDNDSIELTANSFNNDDIYCVNFSKDGKFIAWGTGDGFIETYNLDMKKPALRWEAHGLLNQNKTIWSINYSFDSKKILSGAVDFKVRYWDAFAGDTILDFTQHSFHVRSVKCSHDGRFALSGSLDNTARQYDINYGFAIPSAIVNHGGQIISVDYSYDDNYFLTTGRDKSIKVWKNLDSIKFKDSSFSFIKFQATVKLPHIVTQKGKRINAILSFDNKFDLSAIGNTKYKAYCEIEYPYNMLDKVFDKTFIKNVKFDTLKLDIVSDFKEIDIKYNLFNVLSSNQKYGDLRILKFNIIENDIFDIINDDGSVTINEDCPANNNRNIEISQSTNMLELDNEINPSTLFINLVEDGYYILNIINLNGDIIKNEINGYLKPGQLNLPISYDNIPNGNYFFSLKLNEYQNSVKFLIIK